MVIRSGALIEAEHPVLAEGLTVLVRGFSGMTRRDGHSAWYALVVLGLAPLSIYIYSVVMDELRFEWDARKNRENQRKHGVSFEEARSVFYGHHCLFQGDGGGIRHSLSESH